METEIHWAEDFRVNPRPVLAGFFLLGIICMVFAVDSNEIRNTLILDSAALSFFLCSVLGWVFEKQFPCVTRWLSIGALTASIFFPAFVFGLDHFWSLLFVPCAIGILLVGMPAGILVAGIETLFLFVRVLTYPRNDPAPLIMSVLGSWLICLFFAWVTMAVRRNAIWSWNYRQEANREFMEIHSRREQHEKSVKDLADANLQMRALNRLAHNLRLAAENAKTTKEQFVANVSHELRTPLNMITGYTEMILNSPGMYGRKIPGALLADLGVIQRNAEHLMRLINDVLDLSQVEVDQMALSKEMVDFREVVEFSLAAVQPLFRLKNLALTSEIEPNLPPVLCDRTRMQEVLLNILSNAGRFTEQGGVTVQVRREGGSLSVSIRDSGPGIAQENIHRLFTPFEQLDASIRRQYGGTGLGLAISKHFIELHEGRIWVESKEGEGTVFTFTIPLKTKPPLESGANRWITPFHTYESHEDRPRLPKSALPVLMVVERGSTLTDLLSRYMQRKEIKHTALIDEALSEDRQLPVQAFLVNSTNTQEAMQILQSDQVFDRNAPVISCSVPGFDAQANKLDVAGILLKPIHRDVLLKKLGELGILTGTILIVDDEPDALHLFARMLTSTERDYQILTARDGQEAIQILRDYRPDAILMDLIMPNMSGFRFLEMRAEHPELQGIPIIIISARDPSGQMIVSGSLSVALPKGFSVRQLIGCVEALNEVLSAAKPDGDPRLTTESRD